MNLKNVRFKRTDLWETYGCNFSVEIPRILHRLVTENVRFERTDILSKKRTDMISPLRSFVTSRNSFKKRTL